MKKLLPAIAVFSGFLFNVLSGTGQHSLDDRLHMAAYNGNCQEIQQLLEKGANINAQMTDGATALLIGACNKASFGDQDRRVQTELNRIGRPGERRFQLSIGRLRPEHRSVS
jgi:hypothetical protein